MTKGILFHFAHSADGVVALLAFYGSGDTIDAQVVEHGPVSARAHLVGARRSQLARVLAAVVDAARVHQNRVGVEELFGYVDLSLQLVDG